MGAVLATAAVARSMEENGTFYSTYGWHPRSVAVAITTVRYIARHKSRLLRNVSAMSEYFRARLSQMEFKQPAPVRIHGLAIAIEVGDARYASRIQSRCRDEGLLLAAEEEILMMMPALNIEQPVARRGLDILENAL
jgi:acetylornithine/succinyldiaminopimelate/putrescine aminotransferase